MPGSGPVAPWHSRTWKLPTLTESNSSVARVGEHSGFREAMRGKGMAALGRVVLAKRERVIMLEPWEKGLLGTTLRYPSEIRDAKEYFDDIPSVQLDPDMLKLADHILQSKADDFDPSQFLDHYEE